MLWFHLLSGVSRLGQGPQADSALPLAFGLIACSVRFRGVGFGGVFFLFNFDFFFIPLTPLSLTPIAEKIF